MKTEEVIAIIGMVIIIGIASLTVEGVCYLTDSKTPISKAILFFFIYPTIIVFCTKIIKSCYKKH